jgi:serine/threonine-protein kinase RsbT
VIRLFIRHDADVGAARRRARELGRAEGLAGPAVEELALAVTEIARNIVVHASAGEITLEGLGAAGRRGVAVVARDDGPGIPDPDAALTDHWSTGDGLGLGLPGARRLVDEFELVSEAGAGTMVRMRKWAP